MIKLIMEFDNRYFEENDLVSIKRSDSVILTGRIMKYEPDSNHGFWLDISDKFNCKKEWISLRDISSIAKIN